MQLVFRLQERRQKLVTYIALGVSALASFLWLIAICTHGWVELVLPEGGVYLPSLHDDARGRTVRVVKIWSGLWDLCRVEYGNATDDAASITPSTDTDPPYNVKGIVIQVLSSSRDGRPFGHNRHGPKIGGVPF